MNFQTDSIGPIYDRVTESRARWLYSQWHSPRNNFKAQEYFRLEFKSLPRGLQEFIEKEEGDAYKNGKSSI